MSTPKGMRNIPRTLANGDQVFLYHNPDVNQIVLQLRHRVPTEESLLEPSFKVAAALTVLEAAMLAGDLLSIALPLLQSPSGRAISATTVPREEQVYEEKK